MYIYIIIYICVCSPCFDDRPIKSPFTIFTSPSKWHAKPGLDGGPTKTICELLDSWIILDIIIIVDSG